MINGVPVNDMENGRVYWSNWAGLSDVTSSMQVQRGLGLLILPSRPLVEQLIFFQKLLMSKVEEVLLFNWKRWLPKIWWNCFNWVDG